MGSTPTSASCRVYGRNPGKLRVFRGFFRGVVFVEFSFADVARSAIEPGDSVTVTSQRAEYIVATEVTERCVCSIDLFCSGPLFISVSSEFSVARFLTPPRILFLLSIMSSLQAFWAVNAFNLATFVLDKISGVGAR